MTPELRRRQAPRAEQTSDVTRFRGIAIAAVCAALLSAAAALALTSSDALRGSPGPLPLPHRRAGLTCSSCHVDAAPVSSACVGCHGPHPSRPAHRRLAGQLACSDCHAGHGHNTGVVFSRAGGALRYGPGGESAVTAPLYRPRVDVAVPTPTAGACARCHDLSSPRDPIAGCLIAGQEALGLARPTVCFDEHRPAGLEAGAAAARSAAWEAAREVAANAPLAPAASRSRGSAIWLWLGAGALGSVLTWAGARARHRRRSRAPATSSPAPAATRRLPVVNASTCLGCYACVDACPYDVLEIRRYVAVVARPTDCCGLTLCEQKCPNGSLVMADGDAPTSTSTTGSGPIGDSLESREVPGLFLAGDVTGTPLIRNAINQGAQAVRSIAAARPRVSGSDTLDLLIIGAGPAGLSAALEAQELGLRYLALEQGSVADSIRSFPRGKLVLDPDLPMLGRLWLAETSKEELLARWLQVVRRQRPAIREGQRVTAIERSNGDFTVTSVSSDGEPSTHRSHRLLLAVGRRGTPRPLPIDVPADWSDRVHYSLADARSFAGQRVLVVGLGDVAMEAAVALSRQPGTEVVVSYRGDGFHRGKARNIAEVRRREAAGALRLCFRTELGRLEPGRAILDSPQGTVEVRCDAVLAFIGSIPPAPLLRQAGLDPREIASGPEPLKPGGSTQCPDGPEEARS